MPPPERHTPAPIPGRIKENLDGKFSDYELGVLAELSRVVEMDQGETIVTEGSVGNAAAVILEGDVDVLHGGETVATVGAGSIIGEMALLTGAPRSATLVAATPVSIMTLSRKGFDSLLEQCPRLDQVVHNLVDQRAADG